MSVHPRFTELVKLYASAPIQFPQLKPITVAQWMLESGRGSSRLAVEHFNFGGMKFRSELAGLAAPVSHTTTHDGSDIYCRFLTLQDYITGFWRFIARPPYRGFEEHTDSGEDFIRFVGPIWAPAGDSPNNQDYADKVISLLSEATELLLQHSTNSADDPIDDQDLVEEPPVLSEEARTIVIDPGHGGTTRVGGSSPNNAVAHPSGILEKAIVLDIAVLVRDKLLEMSAENTELELNVLMTRDEDENRGLSSRANVARDNRADVFLSIHCNGFNRSAHGVETFVLPSNRNRNFDADVQFSKKVQTRLLKAWRKHRPSTKDRTFGRGFKEQGLGVLNDVALGNDMSGRNCRAVLVELEFIDVPEIDQLLNTGAKANQVRDDIAKALAKAIFEEVSLAP